LRKDPAPHKARHDLQGVIDETITEQKLITAASGVAATYDAQWQTRRRAINMIMLFVYRLVINRQGYAITLSQLWRQCQTYGVPLYQSTPVSAAAMCKARDKLDPFRDVHAAVLAPFEEGATTWNGHRVFAGQQVQPPEDPATGGLQAPVPQCRLSPGSGQLPVPLAGQGPL